MISLIKIRIKYLIRNPNVLFWTYLFLPGLIFIIVFTQRTNKAEKSSFLMQPKQSPINLGEDYFLYELTKTKANVTNKIKRSYSSIKKYLKETSILVNDMSDCTFIQKFIKSESGVNVNCSSIDNFSNNTIYIIKFEKNRNKYTINLNERQIENNTNLLFTKSDIDQDQITNLFYTNKEVIKESKFNDLKFKAFWELQSLFANLIIKYNNKKTDKDFKMIVGLNPYPDHYRFTDNNEYMVYSTLSFIITLQFSLIGYNFNIRMIDEKENKLNLFLERQGISYFKYNVSWLITFYALFLFSIIAFTLLVFSTIIFHFSLVLLSMLLFSFSIYCVCIFFTTCIQTIRTGTTAVKFYNFGSILLGFVIVLPKTSKITKIFFALVPQINLYLCICSIFNLNNFENLSWQRLWLKAAKISYMETLIMYIVDIILYLGLSYFIQVYRESGLSLSSFIKTIFFTSNLENNHISSTLLESNNVKKTNFETHHQDLTEANLQYQYRNQCLKLINVSKNYEDIRAVDNFNGELFPNEIFCLLGHNGAGKSTLINMISGIIDPDIGDILYNGKSLVTNKDYLYENIGLCQQEDIFFDYLTVEEHLEYMYGIKGSIINRNEIEDLICRIDLVSKKDALCKTLSGGQKRKLCIALALIGDSHIILLDEPTSGMDIMARKQLWEFLRNYKKDKIILLTTHFLDEAEYLGDRIGIMSDGHFLCSGTSSFLKSKYPCGFNINLIINPSIFNEDNKNQFFNGILKYHPKAEIKIASKGVFSFNIESSNNNITEMFDYIEENKGNFGIEDYTISSTSLEDVFLKINNKGTLNDIKYSNKDKKENNEKIIVESNIKHKNSFCSQLCAEIIRGILPLWRNKTLFFFELLSGLGFVYIFSFFFSDFIINAATRTLNFITILESNDIYIYEKNTNITYLENSFISENLKSVQFEKIKQEPKNLTDFINIVYNQSYANIAKGALFINGTNPNLLEIYNTEVDTSLNGYFYANIVVFVSAFLKNSYDLNVVIIPEITLSLVPNQIDFNFIKFLKDFIVLIIVCLLSLFGFVIFLGGLMLEKIKEKRTNIKHLLYLSGSNIWSYWLGFFFVDYLKLLLFNIFLIYPISYMSGAWLIFGLDFLTINFSSLFFIYFISFFCTKDDEGAKILFTFIFGFILVLCVLNLTFKDLLVKYSSSFTDIYTINLFDLTPITSMGLSFVRIIISYSIFSSFGESLSLNNDVLLQTETIFGFYRPIKYLYSNFIAQLVNFIIYFVLLILAESGILDKIVHKIKLKIFDNKNNFVFSKETVSDEFDANNNLNSPLIRKEGSILKLDENNEDKNIIQYKLSRAFTNINFPGNKNKNIIQNKLSRASTIKNFSGNEDKNILQNNISRVFANNNFSGNEDKNILQNNISRVFANNNISDNEDKNIIESNISRVFANNNFSGDSMTNPFIKNEIEKLNNDKLLTTKITGLRKTFFSCFCCGQNVRAINNLYLGLEPNEKFGLLGFNGSGKTTTFKAITNEILTDAGTISLFGYDSKEQFGFIRTIIGYCPQINPLFDSMKVREIIKFYSKLKSCNESAESICEKFGLSKYLDTYTVNLSGGNKRKLTFALAMMNKPNLLLLDEPSTGVDPESRRIMWRNINELSNSRHKYNMILTTHSMEEAEVLCDTVSWLKAGNFVAKGNPEKLKLQYSAGYILHIKFNDSLMKSNEEQYDRESIEEVFKNLCYLIDGFDLYSDYIFSNMFFVTYLKGLIKIAEEIKDKTQDINLFEISKDLSFKLVISIIKEKQKELFSIVLNLKNNYKEIDEINISMESLENILTSLN